MEDTLENDLKTARYLAECGVPVFLAARSDSFPAGGSGDTGYRFPSGWQRTEPDPAVLDDFEPGMAVCIVTGVVVDGIDLDPRSGGDLPAEYVPISYGRQVTPSGGTHDLVSPLGLSSKDGLFPGVDIKSGKPNGDGRGFLFIAPTERRSKTTGEVSRYSWETPPDLDSLVLIGGDDSGLSLVQQINSTRPGNLARSYVGPTFEDLPPGKQAMARTYLDEKLSRWADTLQDARSWPENHRDHQGRGWEALARDFAWSMATAAATSWVPLTDAEAQAKYEEILPQELAQDPKCRGKWYEGLIEKAGEKPEDAPPWSGFEEVSPFVQSTYNMPTEPTETGVAEWLYKSGMGVKVAYSGALGWLVWNGRRWRETHENTITNYITQAVKTLYLRAIDLGMDKDVTKKLGALKTGSKIKALVYLVKSEANDSSEEGYDTRADLLNVANGVVNLRTGELLQHDPGYRFTKISNVNYSPGMKHPDFDKVLSALDPEILSWIQVRFGQAATGNTTPDARMLVGVGGGSNGKTTFLNVIRLAMGDFQTPVPNRIILGSEKDHPTEMTQLMGARMAFIDETPAGRYLNTGVLKTMTGVHQMTARKIAKDSITWEASHSLFLMTNHLPVVTDNDHGSVRRFALVKFDKKFPSDGSFATRVADPSGPVVQAALAWIVEGARRFYAKGEFPPLPPKVKKDTDEWMEASDSTNDYIEDRFVLDPNSAVLLKEITEDMRIWTEMQGMRPWSNGLTSARLENSATFKKHGIRPVKTDKSKRLMEQLDHRTATEVPSKPVVYRGIRWRGADEPMGFDPSDVEAPDFAQELI